MRSNLTDEWSVIGLKVVCINEGGPSSTWVQNFIPHKCGTGRIKIGKQFTIRDITIGNTTNKIYYDIVSDDDVKFGWFDSIHFKTLSEVREDKLNELLK
jgi:hypothetical protein